MKKILDMLSEEMGKAFEAAGYDGTLGKVTVSNYAGFFEFKAFGEISSGCDKNNGKRTEIWCGNAGKPKENHH